MKNIAVFNILLCLIFGCSNVEELSKEDYLEYLTDSDNGFLKQRKIGDVLIEIQYMSPEALAIFNIKNDESKFQEALDETKGMSYYKMKLSAEGKSLEDFLLESGVNNPLYYLSYGLEKEIYLEMGDENINVKLFHFERSSGLTNFKTFMLGFDRPITEANTFVIDAEGLNTGPVKIIFNKSDIDNLPKLKIG